MYDLRLFRGGQGHLAKFIDVFTVEGNKTGLVNGV